MMRALFADKMQAAPLDDLKADILHLYNQDCFVFECKLLLTLLENRIGLEEFNNWCIENHIVGHKGRKGLKD